MPMRLLWFSSLLLAGLGLILGGAHLLELPVRMKYEPAFHMKVTSTLYRYFGMVGGPLQMLAALLAAVLAWQVRGRAAFPMTVSGAACLILSLILWLLIVQPVNAAWAEALNTGEAAAVESFQQLASRWESGHVAAFAAWLTGFGLLVGGVLNEVE